MGEDSQQWTVGSNSGRALRRRVEGAGEPKYAGRLPSLTAVLSLPARERLAWGKELGRRFRDEVRLAEFLGSLMSIAVERARRAVAEFRIRGVSTNIAFLQAVLDDPDFAAAQRWRFRHLFVDEFQDVNPLQFRLLEAWRDGRDDLCVVGDPRQAIYSWNGADPRYLTGFAELKAILRIRAREVRPHERRAQEVPGAGGVHGLGREGRRAQQLAVDGGDRALRAARDDGDRHALAEPRRAVLRRVTACELARLAAVDEQRPGTVQVARRAAGERARVVVAARGVGGHAVGHDVELVEAHHDGARGEGGDVGRAGGGSGWSPP